LDTLTAWAGDPALLRYHAVVDVRSVCGDFPLGPDGYDQVVAETGGVLSDLCRGIGTAFDDLVAEIPPPPVTFALTRGPVAEFSVEVAVAGTLLTGGWAYDRALNQVLLDTPPPPGSVVIVRYKLLEDCPA
ncbi:MAG: hypothetical protein KC656_27495, partial [Myxococcales bacterium]|nr:hypothetical protein [Myxococcales bacterium]